MASMKGKAPVSTALLREQLLETQHREMQFRGVLIAMAKEQGRIKFKQATLEALVESEGLVAKTEGEWVIFTYEKRGAEPGAPKEPV